LFLRNENIAYSFNPADGGINNLEYEVTCGKVFKEFPTVLFLGKI